MNFVVLLNVFSYAMLSFDRTCCCYAKAPWLALISLKESNKKQVITLGKLKAFFLVIQPSIY